MVLTTVPVPQNADVLTWFMGNISVITGPIHVKQELAQSSPSSLSAQMN